MDLFAGRLVHAEQPAIKASASAVIESAAELRDRNDAYDAARDQVAAAYSNVLDARAEVIRAVERVYGQLIDRVGRKKAELYFKKAQKRTRKAKVVSPAGGAGTLNV